MPFFKNHTCSHLYTHIITVYCGKFLLLWLPKYVWMFELRVCFWTSAVRPITFCTFPPVDVQAVFIVWLSGQIYSVYTSDKSQGSRQLLIFYHSLFKNDKKKIRGQPVTLSDWVPVIPPLTSWWRMNIFPVILMFDVTFCLCSVCGSYLKALM